VTNVLSLVNLAFVIVDPLSLWDIVILFLAGILTGVINTVAGSGTVVSIGVMVFLGIPLPIANTTNRLGVFFQNLSALGAYKRHYNEGISLDKSITVSTLIGALIGAIVAANILGNVLKWVALFALAVSFWQVLMSIRKTSISLFKINSQSRILTGLLFFVIGFYGGLIQIGVGILMLVVLQVNLSGNWTLANYHKLLIILIYTIPATLYFIYEGMILWKPALLLSLGQIFGAYMSGYLMIKKGWIQKALPFFILFLIIVTASKLLLD
jgi:uncharacterized membrane protein YfcA